MNTPTARPAVEKVIRANRRHLRSLVGERRLRRITNGRKEYYHRSKNGIYDPITYFHIVDVLSGLSGDTFRTREFIELLASGRTRLVWDATTVGRVLNDIAESLEAANGRPYISSSRRWNGMVYMVDQGPEAKAALLNLLDDLIILCDQLIELEEAGKAPPRLNSPLLSCPSVALPA